ncbi:MAG: response regulator, partial [Nitrospiraceae bacterium]
RGKGTGLGLSTALSIVQSHGGFINVSTEMGNGTQMQVFLPAEESTLAQHEDEVKAELMSGHGELVLMVDDEAAILAMTKSALEANGYRVLTAKDGREALALYARRRQEIDIVVSDMMMPFMDGSAMIRELQAINSAVKLIAVSGLPAGEIFAGVPGGASIPFLPKPYTTDKLLTLLKEALG